MVQSLKDCVKVHFSAQASNLRHFVHTSLQLCGQKIDILYFVPVSELVALNTTSAEYFGFNTNKLTQLARS
jgi:hypothetical protein